jgi:hypothetical protein
LKNNWEREIYIQKSNCEERRHWMMEGGNLEGEGCEGKY